VTETVLDQRGWLLQKLSPLMTGSPNRQTRNDETMHVTLTQVRAAAEASVNDVGGAV
jgi:hypothetical protein